MPRAAEFRLYRDLERSEGRSLLELAQHSRHREFLTRCAPLAFLVAMNGDVVRSVQLQLDTTVRLKADTKY